MNTSREELLFALPKTFLNQREIYQDRGVIPPGSRLSKGRADHSACLDESFGLGGHLHKSSGCGRVGLSGP
jgi:hypothetical protein